MSTISRRFLIGAGASFSFAFSVPAFSAQNSKKAIFMKRAITDIQRENSKWRKLADPRNWVKLCVPVPFADFDYYYTDGTLWWNSSKESLPNVQVEHGFCTDLASVPWYLWSIVAPTGRHAYAAIVHDYLYWTQTTTRLVADDVLYNGMEDAGVAEKTRDRIYSTVRRLGQSAWDANAKAKRDGTQKRFLKTFPPRDRLVSWQEWSKDLANFKD